MKNTTDQQLLNRDTSLSSEEKKDEHRTPVKMFMYITKWLNKINTENGHQEASRCKKELIDKMKNDGVDARYIKGKDYIPIYGKHLTENQHKDFNQILENLVKTGNIYGYFLKNRPEIRVHTSELLNIHKMLIQRQNEKCYSEASRCKQELICQMKADNLDVKSHPGKPLLYIPNGLDREQHDKYDQMIKHLQNEGKLREATDDNDVVAYTLDISKLFDGNIKSDQNAIHYKQQLIEQMQKDGLNVSDPNTQGRQEKKYILVKNGLTQAAVEHYNQMVVNYVATNKDEKFASIYSNSSEIMFSAANAYSSEQDKDARVDLDNHRTHTPVNKWQM